MSENQVSLSALCWLLPNQPKLVFGRPCFSSQKDGVLLGIPFFPDTLPIKTLSPASKVTTWLLGALFSKSAPSPPEPLWQLLGWARGR